MEESKSKVPTKEKSSRTHLVTYLLLITVVFVIAAVVGYRSYQHICYRQGLRHSTHDDEESLHRHHQQHQQHQRHQRHQQQPDEYSPLLRSDHLQSDAGKSSASGRVDRGSPRISNLNAIPIPPGNHTTTAAATTTGNNTTTTMTATPKIRIHQLDPSIAYSKRLITIGDVHGCKATRAYPFLSFLFSKDITNYKCLLPTLQWKHFLKNLLSTPTETTLFSQGILSIKALIV